VAYFLLPLLEHLDRERIAAPDGGRLPTRLAHLVRQPVGI